MKEFAFDQQHKLYRTGEFFDLVTDPFEQRPQKRDALSGEAAKAAGKFQKVLDQFNNARPAELDRAFESATRGKAAKKKE